MIDDDVKKKLAGNSIDRKFTQECANMAISLFLFEPRSERVWAEGPDSRAEQGEIHKK